MSTAQGTSGDTVIRASAGTGKTFQLSNRFIGLAARQAPDNILATTFTRKAAGEILDRVLVRLAEAALAEGTLVWRRAWDHHWSRIVCEAWGIA